jgi:hypothetical protein
MAVYPKPITPAYTAFLAAAMYNEPFRQALYKVYQAQPNSTPWNEMKQALYDNSVCVPGQEKPILDEIVKVDWKEVFQMELKLGRGPDDDTALHPLMG